MNENEDIQESGQSTNHDEQSVDKVDEKLVSEVSSEQAEEIIHPAASDNVEVGKSTDVITEDEETQQSTDSSIGSTWAPKQEENGAPDGMNYPRYALEKYEYWKYVYNLTSFIYTRIPHLILYVWRFIKSRFYYYTIPTYIKIGATAREIASYKSSKMIYCEIKAGLRLDPLKCTDKQRREETRRQIHAYINNPWRLAKKRFYIWLNR